MIIFYSFLLILNLVLLFKVRSKIIAIFLFVFWYTQSVLFWITLGVPPKGILLINNALYKKYHSVSFILVAISYLLFWLLLRKLPSFKLKTIVVSPGIKVIIFIAIIIVSIIAIPRVYFGNMQRFDLIGGGSWLSIYVFLNALNLLLYSSKHHNLFTFMHIFFSLFIIVGGERVDSIFILVFYIFLGYDKSGDIYERTIKLKNLFFVFGLVIVGNLVGHLRSQHTSFNMLSVITILYDLFMQHTVLDCIHVYYSAFSYIENYGLNRIAILNDILSILPFGEFKGAMSEYNYTQILDKYINNVNGGLFYTSGVLVLGYLGVIVYNVVFALVIRFIMSSKLYIIKACSMIIFILYIRISWYGILFIYRPLEFYLLSVIMLILIRPSLTSNTSVE